MGTRRMRDLSAYGDLDILLCDRRPDRQRVAAERFGVSLSASADDGFAWDPDVVIVSTPPDEHARYIHPLAQTRQALFLGSGHLAIRLPPGRASGKREADSQSLASCTLYFSSIVREVRHVVRGRSLVLFMRLGTSSRSTVHAGAQGEGDEYYARHRATAPAHGSA